MAVSSVQRALIAAALLVLLAAGAAGLYFYLHHQPLVGPSSGAPPDLMALLPPDAPVVAYADVAALRKLSNSPLAAVLGLASPGPQADKEYAEFVRDTGFDYTRDLDCAVVAMWPTGLGTPAGGAASGGNGAGATNERLVAFGDGRFDRQKIVAYTLRMGRVAQQNGEGTIYEAPGESPGESIYVTFLSNARIVLANDLALIANLPSGKAPRRSSEMQARIERVAGAPVFAVAATDSLPASFYQSFAGSPQLAKYARSVKSITLAGQPDGDNFKVALDGECDSMLNAAQISILIDSARMVGSIALSDPKNRGQMTREQAAFVTALLSQVKVTHQDKWLRLTLTLTPEMLGVPATGAHSASTH